ncbi:MAG TPA: cation-transporting P-type ATPase [Candidatus Binatia bacterium]|nr:cation-transporting P-type ATPase [Candidatus Binatia bacterium]
MRARPRESQSEPVTATPWSSDYQEVLQDLSVALDRGLNESEVKERQRRYGANRLREAQRKSAWGILAHQFRSLIVLLLAVAAAVSFFFGDWVEGAAISAVIFINGAIGFVTELRAVRSMEALRRMGQVQAKVRRAGRAREIPAAELVPGDIVLLEGGDVVSADLRLLEASNLQADESALTGESVPVEKSVERLQDDVPLAERRNMLFKGTALTRGSGEGVVVAIGMETELGHISHLVEEAKEEITPLEKRLDRLGHRLIWVTLIISVFVAVSGIIMGKDLVLMVETAIALAVATIPEGLPIVATIALARGMWRMARRNALVNRLSAVETLGATTIICTDKTGTLTENRMTVRRIALASLEDVEIEGEGLETEGQFRIKDQAVDPSKHEILQAVLSVGVLCNNASLPSEGEKAQAVGDPMEVALLVVGAKAGFDKDALMKEAPEAREEAFSAESKKMATFHEDDGRYRVAVKGSPEAVIERCSRFLSQDGERELGEKDREEWLDRNDRMASEGLRMLAVAAKNVESADADPYENLTFLGLVGLLDPPREDVKAALQACRQAGVRVIMVTGDQPATAGNIARAVGLVEAEDVEITHGSAFKSADELSDSDRQRILKSPIFARISPKQKLDLITVHQQNGAIVAMTGDGVNDAPALKKADIGIAMGQRGTQVAREAADMVLKDDAFSTIVMAIAEGRVIFTNIRKFTFYLLSCNVSEVLVVSLAALVNAPLPILPLQILFLNLVTDVFPALALGVGEGDPAVMHRSPRDPQEAILTRCYWYAIGGYGALITVSVLGAFALAFTWLQMSAASAITVSFLTLAFAQLWHVFNMRDQGSGFWRNDVTQNAFVWGALALCIGLLLAAVYVPGLAVVLRVERLDLDGWSLVLAMSLLPWLIGQISKSRLTQMFRTQRAGFETANLW